MQRLGIDVGGSGIKGALVDLDAGAFIGDRHRIPTPEGFTLDAVLDTVQAVIAHFGWGGPVGVGFPAVVRRGVVTSPPTAHELPGWVGEDVAALLTERQGAVVRVGNDADVAGVAEMRFGAGRDRDGVVVILTLGTGVGSALFNDGVLVPNTELGKLYLENDPLVAENRMAARIREEEDLSFKQWGKRVNEYLQHVDRLFSPDLIVLGGGVSKHADKFFRYLDVDAEVVPAQLRNQAGIVGAASLVADVG